MRPTPCQQIPLRAAAAILFWTLGTVLTVAADGQGWSVDFDRRHRAFLAYVGTVGGPRLLVFGCLRDVESFSVLAHTGRNSGPADAAETLTLRNGNSQYSVSGRFDANAIGIGEGGFVSEFDLNSKSRRELRRKLLPVLEGKGPITVTIKDESQDLSVSGLTAVVGRFKAACFD